MRVVVRHRADRRAVGAAAVVDRDEVAQHRQRVAHRGDARRVLGVVHERDEVGVVEQVPQLGLDVAVVHVDRDRAQLVGGEHRLDELEAVEPVDADVVAGADAVGGEVVREPVGARLELRVGLDPVADDQRDPVGDGVDGVFDEVGDVPGHAPSKAVAPRARNWRECAELFQYSRRWLRRVAGRGGTCWTTEPMAATWNLEFPYRRSVGPVIGEFLGGLRDRRVLGVAHGRRAGCSSRRSSTTRTPARPTASWSRSARPGWCEHVGVDRRAAAQPPARPAVRVGARRASTAPTPRCCTRSTAGTPEAVAAGHTGAHPLGGRDRRQDHRHRLLRARVDERSRVTPRVSPGRCSSCRR